MKTLKSNKVANKRHCFCTGLSEKGPNLYFMPHDAMNGQRDRRNGQAPPPQKVLCTVNDIPISSFVPVATSIYWPSGYLNLAVDPRKYAYTK